MFKNIHTRLRILWSFPDSDALKGAEGLGYEVSVSFPRLGLLLHRWPTVPSSICHGPRPHPWASTQLSSPCHIYGMSRFYSTTDHQPRWNHDRLRVWRGHLPFPESQAPRDDSSVTCKPWLVTLTIPDTRVFHVHLINEPDTKFPFYSVMCDWCSCDPSFSPSPSPSPPLSLKLIPPMLLHRDLPTTQECESIHSIRLVEMLYEKCPNQKEKEGKKDRWWVDGWIDG